MLASASPARLRLLRDAGFAPTVVVSGVDESAVDHDDAFEQVRILASRKANAVADEWTGKPAYVIGCDSMLLLDGEAWGKPETPSDAVDRWKRMRGRSGVLVTGHCVVETAARREVGDVADTLVRFGTPSDDEIAAYVASGEPLHVAGAFTLDGRSAPFIDGVDGDPGNVIGLSLPLLRRLLAQLGVEVTSLWA